MSEKLSRECYWYIIAYRYLRVVCHSLVLQLIVYGFFVIVMEIPNLNQGREKTVKTFVAVFQKYILYWSRLFLFW